MHADNKQQRIPLVTLVLVVVLCLLVPFAFYHIVQRIPALGEDQSLRSNLVFFVIVNVYVIAVMVLGFLVIKNIVKLFFDRRKGILGAKLRSRLVTAFVGLSLIPTALLFVMSKGILERVLEEWFSPQITAAVDGALGVAQYSYDTQESGLYRYAKHLSNDLRTIVPVLIRKGAPYLEVNEGAKKVLSGYLRTKVAEYGLYHMALVNERGEYLVAAESIDAKRRVVDLPAGNLSTIREARSGTTLVYPEHSINGEFLRAYVQISPQIADKTSIDNDGSIEQVVLIATAWVSPELLEKLTKVTTAHDDYRELRTYRRPLGSSYILALIIVTLLIIFSAIWVGFYLAKSLTIPIQRIAEGTQAVAHGNLEHRIPEVGDDELGILVRSFNQMTTDLQQTTGELVARRHYMETVLASVGVGVVSVDLQGAVTTINVAAAEIIDKASAEDCLGKPLFELLPEGISKKIQGMLTEVYQSTEKVATLTVDLDFSGQAKKVQVTINKLVSEDRVLGSVFLFDDLTELVQAQRMAAWREVARRIAHEIKNPLTPIQLSAQRVQRRFSKEDSALGEDDQKVINEATEVIVSQVEAMRNLVNEFSRFARMPKANPRPTQLNSIIEEVEKLYTESHEGVELEVEMDDSIPEISLDREQINRVFINLIDNSLTSVIARAEQGFSNSDSGAFGTVNRFISKFKGDKKPNGFIPRIKLVSRYDREIDLVVVEVSDNGLGISDEDKRRLFEPYFSTKSDGKGGTGLGLAIVNTIIADHNGFIRVRDNDEGGATFLIELPVARQVLRA